MTIVYGFRVFNILNHYHLIMILNSNKFMNILNDYFNILIFQLSICLKFKISKAHHHGFLFAYAGSIGPGRNRRQGYKKPRN